MITFCAQINLSAISLQNDRVLSSIYKLRWYQLPSNEIRRQYIMLVLAAQNPKQLMVDVTPLGLHVFVSVRMVFGFNRLHKQQLLLYVLLQVMKTVYSIIMILIK